MIEAVIYDLDGLLVDTEPIWQDVESTVFTSIGLPISRSMTKQTMGMRVDEAVNYWYDRKPWNVSTKKEIEERIIRGVVEKVKTDAIPMDGVLENVELFHRIDIPIAIASSSCMEIIEAAINKIGIGRYIRIIHSAEFEEYGKPHPAVYLTTAMKLGVSPQNCLAFEDSLRGVESAKAAGMWCVAVPNPHLQKDSGFEKADMVIDSLEAFRIEFLDHFK